MCCELGTFRVLTMSRIRNEKRKRKKKFGRGDSHATFQDSTAHIHLGMVIVVRRFSPQARYNGKKLPLECQVKHCRHTV